MLPDAVQTTSGADASAQVWRGLDWRGPARRGKARLGEAGMAQHRGWGVVYTHPRAERWAEANLARAGYRVFLPLRLMRRRDPVLRTLTHLVEVPLFVRYVFTYIDGLWTPIRYLPGVNNVLMADGRPQLVDAGVVEALQAGEALRRCPDAPGAVWRPGEPCSLLHGPLAELPAVVLSVERRQARIAVMLMGNLTTVRAPVAWLASRD